MREKIRFIKPEEIAQQKDGDQNDKKRKNLVTESVMALLMKLRANCPNFLG